MNIQFGSNFMGRDEFHELTGEPYLAVTHYGPPLKPRHFAHLPKPGEKRRWVDKLFMEELGKGSRKAYRPRKWPNMPGRLVYTLWRKNKATLCPLGIHLIKADIIELDASVWRAECQGCHRLVRAKKPRPADEAEAQRLMESNRKSLEMHEAIVAYHEGRGPCPFCTPPEGAEHADDCWEVFDGETE